MHGRRLLRRSSILCILAVNDNADERVFTTALLKFDCATMQTL